MHTIVIEEPKTWKWSHKDNAMLVGGVKESFIVVLFFVCLFCFVCVRCAWSYSPESTVQSWAVWAVHLEGAECCGGCQRKDASLLACRSLSLAGLQGGISQKRFHGEVRRIQYSLRWPKKEESGREWSQLFILHLLPWCCSRWWELWPDPLLSFLYAY